MSAQAVRQLRVREDIVCSDIRFAAGGRQREPGGPHEIPFTHTPCLSDAGGEEKHISCVDSELLMRPFLRSSQAVSAFAIDEDVRLDKCHRGHCVLPDREPVTSRMRGQSTVSPIAACEDALDRDARVLTGRAGDRVLQPVSK